MRFGRKRKILQSKIAEFFAIEDNLKHGVQSSDQTKRLETRLRQLKIDIDSRLPVKSKRQSSTRLRA